MIAILHGHLIPSRKSISDTILALIHSEVLQNCPFHVFATLVTAANGHLGLSSGMYLKGFYLQIILIESD